MNIILRRWLNNCKRRLQRRLDKTDVRGCDRPMFTASNIHYEASGRVRGITHGGIGAIHTLAQQLGLVEALDRRLQLLVIHLPYHESDHVLNIADNALCEGTCLEDIELRRNDANFLNALGAAASLTRPPPAISAAASRATMCTRCSTSSTTRA